MFYGPLGSALIGTAIPRIAPEVPQIVHEPPGAERSMAQADGGGGGGQAPQSSVGIKQPAAAEEDVGDEYYEEYEEDEYEEAEGREEEEPENMSGDGSYSNSLASSLEGEHHLRDPHKVFTTPHPPAHAQHNHQQRQPQFPFDGKRHFSNGFHAPPAKLGHKTVQAIDDHQLASELAARGLQMICAPDCEPKAFAILIDFVYSDFDVRSLSVRGQLTDDNVMNALYAAKKYAIDALVAECVRYCTARLTATNAVSLLAQARLFDEGTLVEQCYQVIDQNTDVALEATNVADIDRNTLINVLGRSQLDPSSELIIFNAAKAWAEAECSRRSIDRNMENLRKCLGPAMQLIRFSLMDVNAFGVAASSSLLTCEEIAEVFLHLTVRPRPQCRFSSRGFRANSRSKHTVQRFSTLSSKRCTRRENKICFTADRDVLISGVAIYGANQAGSRMIADENSAKTSWEHKVAIKLELVADLYGSPLELLASNEILVSGTFGDPTPFVAHFSDPVPCLANTTYLVTARFMTEEGVSTFQGKEGQAVVSVELPFDQTVRFKFQAWRNAADCQCDASPVCRAETAQRLFGERRMKQQQQQQQQQQQNLLWWPGGIAEICETEGRGP
uniref:BACK domain-containing protein n=1 Tax=Globodera pallida TaxID=36090 RepID=A0A183C3M4_GLOPA